MKKIMLFTAVMMIATCVFSQSATVQMITFNKRNVEGVSISTADYDVKLTTAALQNYFENVAKLRGRNQRGFRVYLAQQFPEFGSLNYDIYTQVIQTGKRNERRTVINLLVSKGNENFVNVTSDPELIERILNFLEQFVSVHLPRYAVTQQAQAQTKAIARMERDHRKIVSDRDRLQRQLDNKEKERTAKEKELTNARNLLQSLQNSK